MTSKIDRFMVNLGFSKSEIRKVKYRRILYLGITFMAVLAAVGLGLNLGV